jgi:large subunit ribosomal protein L24
VGVGIRTDDVVEIIAGDDRGKRGKVLRALPKKSRVWVEGINMVKRHTKPRSVGQQGGILEKEAPVHISNVRLVSRGGLAVEDVS